MRRSPVRRSRSARTRRASVRRGASLIALAGACVTLLAGCGEAQQSRYEASGSFPVQVSHVSFPAKQAIARTATLTLTIRNVGNKTMPDVAVTMNGLSYRATTPKGLADPNRPTWIVDTGPGPLGKPPVESEEILPPGGGETAFVHTWALGKLAPGASKAFSWTLTPVKPGTDTVHYVVAAGLNGKAKAVLSSGGRPVGRITVHVAPAPPVTHINPETGAVVPGPAPVSAGPVGAVP